MNHKQKGLLLLALILLGTTGRRAFALYQETHLTPFVLQDAWASYTVKVSASQIRGKEGAKEFVVTVIPRAGRKLSLSRRALLEIMDGENVVAAIPLEEKMAENRLTYWFRVAPKMLAETKFSFGQNAYKLTKDGKGNSVVMGIPGGGGAYFYLQDFISPKIR